jgi:ABC-type transport system involved in multi-copper enzyme maturation permease subunit
MQFRALIFDCFRESLDRKIFWVMLLIEFLVAAAMFCIGFEPGKIDVLFGVWPIETNAFTAIAGLRSDLIAAIAVHFMMDLFLGWVGITLAIIATAGFFPTMLERGAVDVVLAKPISRPALFLGKYLGSMVFVLLHAVFFIGLTFAVIGLRWGVWLPGYLLCIPLLVVLFSYIYCVSAFAGVAYRSAAVAVMFSLGAWVCFFGVQATADLFETFPRFKEHRWAYHAVRTARWVVPKTHDITYLAGKWSGASASTELIPEVGEEEDRQAIEDAGDLEVERMNVNPVYTLGSSLLFEALVVAMAMWKFSRKDY